MKLFKGIKYIDKAKEYLVKVLKTSINNEVNILILPELTVDDDLIDFLQKRLKGKNRENVSSGGNGLLMLVAGSFHRTNGNYGEDETIQEDEASLYNIILHPGH